MRKPVPRSINLKGIGTPPLRLAFLLVLALSGCTTFKPPQISYDDDVPPSPDLPMPADDHARPLHVPPSWTPARGGRKGDEEAKEPAAGRAMKKPKSRRSGSRQPTTPRASSRGGQGISTRSRSFHTVPGRSIRSTLPQGRSRI